MKQRKLPVGIQSFEKLRNGNYLYVDKTKYIQDLIDNGSTYFLSRPRRFGKSLLLSTIEAYFKGKQELFKGLYIEQHENAKDTEAWTEYPVIHFSLADGDYQNESGLIDKFNSVLENAIIEYHLEGMVEGNTQPVRFSNLIYQLYLKKNRQVVVLVDEYDKPLLDVMTLNPDQEEKNRIFYKSFFSVLKSQDQYLKFIFITGVTRFSKVSIFSDLNQLNDISLNDRYSSICGITETELLKDFTYEIKNIAEANDQTEKEAVQSLANMYDGYHFSKKSEGVYNPFSLLNAFYNNDYGSYWYSTGTPAFLIRTLEESNATVEQFTDGVEAKESVITDYRADNLNPIPLFYQSGYLTISAYDKEFRIYTLHFPNEEVRYGFLNSLMPSVLGEKDSDNPRPLKNMVLSLRNGNISGFIQEIESLFAGIPYVEGQRHTYEQEWRNEIYLILSLLGQNVRCEVHTAQGRADCVVETYSYIYIFEFKVDACADDAIKQINEKKYGEKYKTDLRKLYKVGISFSSEKRNILEWKVE